VRAVLKRRLPKAAAPADRLLRRITRTKLNPEDGRWSQYYDDALMMPPPWERPRDEWTLKESSVASMLERLQPKSVLDVGSNQGWFALMAEERGASVVAMDTDEIAVNHLYQEVSAAERTVLPLIMDVCSSTPQRELGIGTVQSAAERFSSDLVMVLAVAHHLVSREQARPQRLAHLLAPFCKQHLLLEFVPIGDSWWTPSRELESRGWTLDLLISAFSDLFELLAVEPSYPEGRQLLLLRRVPQECGPAL
jgi:SAM-dependent methyltransferase